MKIKHFLICLAVFFSIYAKAGISEFTLFLNKANIVSGAGVALDIKDPTYISFDSWASYSTKVSLIYGRQNQSDISTTAWTYTVNYTVKFLDINGNVTSIVSGNTLTISSDLISSNSTQPVYEAVKHFNLANHNQPRAQLIIDSFTPSPSTSIPADVRLEITLIKDKKETLNTAILSQLAYNDTDKRVYWSYQYGAEYYELEWVYIDTFDVHTAFVNPQDPFVFKEPVTVTTSKQHFDFNKTYPKGTIYFRVRGVSSFVNAGESYPNELQYGAWSYGDYVSNKPALWIINTIQQFEVNKNWQYVTSYAEEGKYKKVMSFYDGSLRNRQNLINVSTDTTVIASEVKYDYEGRGVVNIIPAALSGNSLYYVAGLNQFTSGNLKTAFDNKASSLALDSATGSARYFSSLNNFNNSVNRDYIPNAEGYAYSQTTYRRDNTGRISKQSGVGKVFKIDTTASASDRHFTQYFYGSPTDTELKRLFGSNVGKTKHYKKNIVIDPNGQISVSYLDQEGRTVASGLGGASPQNVNALSSNVTPVDIKVSMNENNIVGNYFSRSTNKIQNLVVNQSYDFKYDFTGVVNKADTPFNTTFCKACTYELKIKIIDPDGIVIRNITEPFTPPSITCSDQSYAKSAASTGLTGVQFAKIGEYTVIKELVLSSGAIDVLMTDLKGASTYPDSASIVQSYVNGIDTNQCNFTCEDHCLTQVKRDHPGYTQSQIDTAVANCVKTSCGAMIDANVINIAASECLSLKNQMMDQLRPSGYYNAKLNWLDTARVHVTSFHNPDGTVRAVKPTVDTLRNSDLFESQWAEDLFSQHPEKCHYDNCKLDTLSSIYDKNMSKIKGWNEAINTGYINPLNMSTGAGSPTSNYKKDPFFDTGGRSNGQSTSLAALMTTYKSEVTDNLDYNNSGGISGTVSLWTYSNYKGLYGGVLPDTAKRWNTFRGLYSGEKLKKNIVVTSCTYQPKDSNFTIVQKPELSSTQADINSSNMLNIQNACENGCTENIKLWMNRLKTKCSITWQGTDSSIVAVRLKSYCLKSCGLSNPLTLLIKEHITTDPDLIAAQNIVANATYNCTLDSIATQNPCVRTVNSSVINITRAIRGNVALLNEFIEKTRNSQGTANVFTYNTLYNISNYDVYTTYSDIFPGIFNQIKINSLTIVGFGWGLNGANQNSTDIFLASLYNTYNVNFTQISSFANLRVNPSSATTVLVDVTTYSGNKYTVGGGPFFSYVHGTGDSAVTKSYTYAVCDSISSANPLFTVAINPRTLKDSCIAEQKRMAIFNGRQAWKDTVDRYVSSYLQAHFNKCFNTPFVENFYYKSKEPRQYHYTLYYYDQSGNLIQTVPPSGVDLLAMSAFDTTGRFTGAPPVHRLKTIYKYNTLNQLVWQTSPDGGNTNFFYDDKARLKLSQNAKQKAVSTSGNQRYSYTRYDDNGRIVEVGQIENFPYDSAYACNPSNASVIAGLLNDPLFPAAASYVLTQITKTIYDIPYAGSFFTQTNLRNRVSASIFMPDEATIEGKTWYSYDIHGNVKTMSQDVPRLGQKQIDYEYQLISGNVKKVFYQKGKKDQFVHAYKYDADNRIVSVKTSTTSLIWEEDAKYFYYKHGPLARVELGEDKVQGTDYYYTLQGWLKGVNTPHFQQTISGRVMNLLDPGKDGTAGSTINKFVGQDEYQMALGYYEGDYKSINSVNLGAGRNNANINAALLGAANKKGLYNGNIAWWVNDARSYSLLLSLGNNDGSTRAGAYQYDQLNRLVKGYSLNTYASEAVGWSSRDTSQNVAYDFRANYDPNGNIKWLKRVGSGTSLIDNLSYNYNVSGVNLTNNRLRNITDAAGTSGADIGTQSTDNYLYDEIGNLKKDVTEQIDTIKWTVYGKVQKVIRTSGSTKNDIEFKYDAQGNRIVKIVKPRPGGVPSSASAWIYTYYVRDASGNVMGLYTESAAVVKLAELPIYGSDRIGEFKPDMTINGDELYPSTLVLTLQPDATVGIDARVTDQSATTNYGTYTEFTASYNGTNKQRSLIKFDLSSIPQSNPVSDATMYLYKAGTGHTGTNSSYLKGVTATWAEGTVTWSNQPATTATQQASIPSLSASSDAVVNVTGITQNYVNAPSTSFGMLLTLQNEATQGTVLFASSDHATSSLRPKLVVTYAYTPVEQRKLGRKSYELKDHLGNVRVTIADVKTGIDTVSDGINKAHYYITRAGSYNDYGPFGEILPGRNFNSSTYRYGFNGKEYDPEWNANTGTMYDYGFRIYDPRIAKFLSVDPLTKGYPELTPYQFASNSPIENIDLDGLESFSGLDLLYKEMGNVQLVLENAGNVLYENTVNKAIDGYNYAKNKYEAANREVKGNTRGNNKQVESSLIVGETIENQNNVGVDEATIMAPSKGNIDITKTIGKTDVSGNPSSGEGILNTAAEVLKNASEVIDNIRDAFSDDSDQKINNTSTNGGKSTESRKDTLYIPGGSGDYKFDSGDTLYSPKNHEKYPVNKEEHKLEGGIPTK